MVLVHGPNGAGKTNLLEALHVGTQGFSPRARGDGQMIRFGAEAARVALRGVNGDATFEADVTERDLTDDQLVRSAFRDRRIAPLILRAGSA